MSPRSMSSTNTKGPSATPGALGGSPSSCPSRDSPVSPFPLLPLSPAASPESTNHDARVGNSMSHDRTMSHAGPGRTSDARLGPELMQSGEIVYNRKLLFTFLHFTVAQGICHRLCSQAASAAMLQGSNSSAMFCTAAQQNTGQAMLQDAIVLGPWSALSAAKDPAQEPALLLVCTVTVFW